MKLRVDGEKSNKARRHMAKVVGERVWMQTGYFIRLAKRQKCQSGKMPAGKMLSVGNRPRSNHLRNIKDQPRLNYCRALGIDLVCKFTEYLG